MRPLPPPTPPTESDARDSAAAAGPMHAISYVRVYKQTRTQILHQQSSLKAGKFALFKAEVDGPPVPGILKYYPCWVIE
jgi:hypothetical protein